MKLIKPDAHVVVENNPFRKVERIGRTCYKSEDKITDTSCYAFVDGLIARKHFAMLEHANFHFLVESQLDIAFSLVNIPAIVVSYIGNHQWIVTVTLSHVYNPLYSEKNELLRYMRRIIEHKWRLPDDSIRYHDPLSDVTQIQLVDVDALGEDIRAKHELVSIHFLCDRGVSHELVRHRCSVAQESTRYCNYSKDKFGAEIIYIEPSTYNMWPDDIRDKFADYLQYVEGLYMDMINSGLQPQQARAVLPNALKTEVILSMTIDRWEHFFNLRSKGTTGQPHPDMKQVADIAYESFLSYLHVS